MIKRFFQGCNEYENNSLKFGDADTNTKMHGRYRIRCSKHNWWIGMSPLKRLKDFCWVSFCQYNTVYQLIEVSFMNQSIAFPILPNQFRFYRHSLFLQQSGFLQPIVWNIKKYSFKLFVEQHQEWIFLLIAIKITNERSKQQYLFLGFLLGTKEKYLLV